jgi:hypothetical protein
VAEILRRGGAGTMTIHQGSHPRQETDQPREIFLLHLALRPPTKMSKLAARHKLHSLILAAGTQENASHPKMTMSVENVAGNGLKHQKLAL